MGVWHCVQEALLCASDGDGGTKLLVAARGSRCAEDNRVCNRSAQYVLGLNGTEKGQAFKFWFCLVADWFRLGLNSAGKAGFEDNPSLCFYQGKLLLRHKM